MTEFYTNVTRYGKNVLYRGIKDGKKVLAKVPFSPTLFVSAKGKKTDWMSLYGQPVSPMKFTDMKEAKEFVARYEGVEGFPIFGMEKYEYQFIIEQFPSEVEYMLSDMNIQTIDIETAVPEGGGFPDIQSASNEILLISMKRKGEKKVVVFAAQSYEPTGENDMSGCEIDYRVFKDEASMLRAFVNYWISDYPDIITGWNTDTFDVPYIINRVNRILGDDWMTKMSPWGLVREKKIEIRGDLVQVYELMGVNQLDYLVLYRKFSFTPQESYALGHVANEELGTSKLEYDCSFREFYTTQWNKFVEYNIIDTQLVDKMDDKFKFIELCIQIAYMAKCNFQDVFSPVKTWDIFIYSYLHGKKIAIPQNARSKISGTIEGAYVKDPSMGMKEWIVSFDFASLYPSIIRQWNISPETIVLDERADVGVRDVVDNNEQFKEAADNCIAKNYTIAANGTMYRKDKKGVFPQLMEFCLVGRKVAKKEMLKLEQEYQNTHDETLVPKIAALDGKQMALKILANSGYGAMCNVGFRYFMLQMGEAITLTGQASNMHLEKSFNAYFSKILKKEDDYVLYCDTDSDYVNVKPFIDAVYPGRSVDETVAFLEKCDDQFQKVINASVDSVYEQCNCFEKVMASKREAIASKGFWTAKKRYALMVHNSEGVSYNPPKIKVMGLDLVKTSTPAAIRKMLKDSLPVIFDTNEATTQKYIAKCHDDFMNLPPEEIAFPRGVSDIDKWIDNKGNMRDRIPIHCRAAVVYNKSLSLLPNKDKYQKLSNGDKLRFIYLKMPNTLRENIYACPANGKFPVELNLETYYDYELQFEKAFMGPMRGLVEAIGWNAEEQSSLEDFFV